MDTPSENQNNKYQYVNIPDKWLKQSFNQTARIGKAASARVVHCFNKGVFNLCVS